MSFSIHQAAKEYIYKRFPKASISEKEKYVKDWDNKVESSLALVEDFKKRVGDPKGKKIIDVGCGNGGTSIAFAMAGADVCGVEIENELYEISKAHALSFGVNPNFYLYDGGKLPFADNSFNYAISASVLEHTTSPQEYIKEIYRVLKPGGKLYLGFPNKWWPKETHTGLWFLTYLPKFLRPLYIKAVRRNPLEENNLHFYSFFDLKKMIEIKKGYRWQIMHEAGESTNLIKGALKGLLKIFNIPYKVVLAHILVVLVKN